METRPNETAAIPTSDHRQETSSACETSPISSAPEFFQPNGKCRRCDRDLDGGRLYICERCEKRAEDYWAERKSRDEHDAIDRELLRSALPRDYRQFIRTIADVPARYAPILQACEQLGSHEVPGLYLYGEAQRFKTTIAAAWLAAAVRRGASGRYVDVVDLLTDIQRSYSDDMSDSRAKIVARYADVPLLVLDDVGQEKASHHAGEVLRQILDNRRRTWRPGYWMVITSNRSPENLRDRFEERETGDSILHRISQLTVTIPMEQM
jgi:DNA replication protein DnaC